MGAGAPSIVVLLKICQGRIEAPLNGGLLHCGVVSDDVAPSSKGSRR